MHASNNARMDACRQSGVQVLGGIQVRNYVGSGTLVRMYLRSQAHTETRFSPWHSQPFVLNHDFVQCQDLPPIHVSNLMWLPGTIEMEMETCLGPQLLETVVVDVCRLRLERWHLRCSRVGINCLWMHSSKRFSTRKSDVHAMTCLEGFHRVSFISP